MDGAPARRAGVATPPRTRTGHGAPAGCPGRADGPASRPIRAVAVPDGRRTPAAGTATAGHGGPHCGHGHPPLGARLDPTTGDRARHYLAACRRPSVPVRRLLLPDGAVRSG